MLVRNFIFLAVCLVALSGVAHRLLPSHVRPMATTAAPLVDPGVTEVARQIDEQFAQAAHEQHVALGPWADEATLCRRLALGLIGSIPSLEELRTLEQFAPDQRVARYLEHLLQDRRCHDYLAERLARCYVGIEDGPFLVYRRRRFVTWLSDQVAANRPYDELVRELLSGTGLWTDAPAVNFVTVTNDINGDQQPDEERLAARTARAFLGVRLDCVQCHNDNLGGDWRQQDFQQLAAFFADAHSSLLGITDAPRDYKFTYLHHADEEVVPPAPPFEQALRRTDGPKRTQLARWVTHPDNTAFSRAIANRMWALLTGRPLVTPVDDIPLAGPYPPGLDRLAQDFSTHGYDLRRLIRVITSTRAFRTGSRAPEGTSAEQEACWAVFPLSRLRPEQVAGAVQQASALTTLDAQTHILIRLARYGQQTEFVKRYGDTGIDDFVDRGGTIPQRLLLMNGEAVRERTKEDLINNAASRIAALSASDETSIETAYRAILTRRPSSAELNHFLARLQEAGKSNRRQVIEDLYWALFNSTEFSWNH